ncbi:selenium metabolism-associated LysR family transcriptional regulator [Neobacillus sp. LXY-1]|uniref:selenium metabolism-associated LysR family transcriptional regulator n=1 Tax=Neobacillus sp. LXY-1 TaxID=3379133 RepID=UPI003EDFD70B
MDLDLHQLFVFTKVVEHKSFSKAAEDIFLSQSTVSSHIHGLEKSLNLQLFDRIGREIILTPHGERLYQWALKLLLLKDQAIMDLKQGLTKLRGMIRIAASSVPGEFMLPKMVKEFRELYPDIIFHIDQASSKNVAEKVLNGSVDLGILGEKYANEKLCYIPIFKEKLVLVTSKQVDISGPVQIQDILHLPFVMRSSDSGTNAILERFLKKKHITKDQLNIIAYIEDGQSLMQFVVQDVAISILSEIAAREYQRLNMLEMHEICDFDDERFFYLVYNVQKTQSIFSKLFIDYAPELIKK